jgi:hypothetical protein
VRRQRLTGLVAATALVITGGTLVVWAWPGDGTGATTPQAAAAPAAPPPTVAEVVTTPKRTPAAAKSSDGPPVKARSRNLDIAPADPAARRADVPRRDTDRFSMVSLTWTDPKDAPTGPVEVRTRKAGTGSWSDWQPLETEEARGPDQPAEADGIRGGTGAIWVGESDGVAARVLSASGADPTPLPAGLKLHLIDPGQPAAKKKSGSGGQGGGLALAPSTPPAAAAAATPFPAYTSRAGWGADETLTGGTISYADSVKVQFVHHTAGSNTYTCAQSPAIVRGILYDHTQNRGWDDIGYNFLVDKCGTLFEGRRGGVDRAVIGAHTYGFNTLSSGVAVLGHHSTTAVPPAVTATVARLAAAKLGQYGLSAAGTSQLTEGVSDGKFPLGTVVTFQRISGHRDGVNTECPGDVLYNLLPAIRNAATAPTGLVLNAPTGGVASNGVYYVKGTAQISWTVATPSEDLTRFDVLVDGRVAGTLAGTARAATVGPLIQGTRQIQVRAVHTLGGTATTAARVVWSDTIAPTFPKPANGGFRTGTVSATSVPMAVTWQAADNGRIASLTATAPVPATFGTTATVWNTAAKPAVATTFTIAAKDVVGHGASSSVSRTPVLVRETAASRSGTWRTVSSSVLLDGAAYYTSARNAKLTWTFTGRAVGLIFTRGSAYGRADIYVDGVRVGTVDTRVTGANQYRFLSWYRAFPSSGSHTVQVVGLATSGRPGIAVDGMTYLR